MDELQTYLGLGAVAVVVALVQVVKGVWADMPDGWKPVVAIALGVAWNVGLAWQLQTPYASAVVLGIICGLAASGLYSAGKTVA